MRVTHRDHPDDTAHAKWQVDRAVEIMDAAGAREIVPSEVDEATGQRTGTVVEYDETEVIFTNPKEKRTEDYVTGRFG